MREICGVAACFTGALLSVVAGCGMVYFVVHVL